MKYFESRPFYDFDQGWAILTAGTGDDYNCMTISWGELGTLWNKQVATVYVRPNRYTHELMEKQDIFTIGFFADHYHKDLEILGTLSGKDGDKLAKTSLTPTVLEQGVIFKEAKVNLVCKKIYRQELDLSAMPKEVQETIYATDPVHTMYIGEVMEVIR